MTNHAPSKPKRPSKRPLAPDASRKAVANLARLYAPARKEKPDGRR